MTLRHKMTLKDLAKEPFGRALILVSSP